jgi:hypothetical protein
MAVSAEKVANRDIYSVSYDPAAGEGIVTATFENQADGDKSQYKGLNDGEFIVTVAAGYSGSDNVTITDANGHELDSGEVTFG